MNQVVVLNKAWAPVDIISVFDAVTKLYQDKAWALDASCKMYKWEDWVRDWSQAATLAQEVISTPNLNIPIPRVIVLREYKGFIKREPKCNRRNLYKRDNETCQYCGKKGEIGIFDIEHIVPQSRGGKTKWTNVVLSCKKCNQKKANRTPAEAGMKLLKKPYKPRWSEIKGDKSEIRQKFNSWHELLSDMYWNVELDET